VAGARRGVHPALETSKLKSDSANILLETFRSGGGALMFDEIRTSLAGFAVHFDVLVFRSYVALFCLQLRVQPSPSGIYCHSPHLGHPPDHPRGCGVLAGAPAALRHVHSAWYQPSISTWMWHPTQKST
jgi:hypothetical protein